MSLLKLYTLGSGACLILGFSIRVIEENFISYKIKIGCSAEVREFVKIKLKI
jgi:hypothetical protein